MVRNKEDNYLFEDKNIENKEVSSTDSYPTGVLPSQTLRELINEKVIFCIHTNMPCFWIQQLKLKFTFKNYLKY